LFFRALLQRRSKIERDFVPTSQTLVTAQKSFGTNPDKMELAGEVPHGTIPRRPNRRPSQ